MRSLRLTLLAALFAPALAVAAPGTIQHSGRMIDATGAAVDGVQSVTFRLYSAAAGGSAIWTETKSVSFDNGYFSATLGDSSAIGDSVLDNGSLYLSIALDSGAELSPRLPVNAVPYALQAKGLASGAVIDASEVRINGTTVIDSSGAVVGADIELPPDLEDGDDDTLADLSCTNGQLISFQGGAWACANASSLTIDANQLTGTVAIDNLPVGTGSGQVAAGDHSHDSQYYSRSEADSKFLTTTSGDSRYYTKTQIDGLITVPPAKLSARIASTSSRVRAYTNYYDLVWQPASGTFTSFTSTGGPVEFVMSIPMSGGSHSACRTVIDGIPTAMWVGTDSTYIWQDGLMITNDGWQMYNNNRIIEGIPAGSHTAWVECIDDSTGADTQLGNSQMTRTFAIIPYEPANSSPIKAVSKHMIVDRGISTSFSSVSGFNTQFQALGGPVKISLSIPMTNGSHSSCRPLIDGVPAGQSEGDVVGDRWQEGLTRTNDNWAMWNRTRIYSGISAGTRNLTVECVTDGGTVQLGNGAMTSAISVVAYPPSSDGSSPVAVYSGRARPQQNIAVGSNWVTINNLGTSITTFGAPVEIGVSLPMSGGSTSTCRPTLNGNPIQTGEIDDFGYIWHDGLVYTADGWAQWDRTRVYKNIPAGTYNLGVQCRTDSGTVSVGTGNATMHVWAVAHKP